MFHLNMIWKAALAIVFTVLVLTLCGLAFLSLIRTMQAQILEPLPSTPAEISQTILESQIAAMGKEGFSQECLLKVKNVGERCIELCGPNGIYLIFESSELTCAVVECHCIDNLDEIFDSMNEYANPRIRYEQP